MNTTFDVRDVPPEPVLLVRETCTVKDIPSSLGRIFGDVMRWAGQHHVDVKGPAFARYLDMHGDTFTLEAGFGIKQRLAAADAPITPGQLGDCAAAHAVHVGPYETLGETHAALQSWLSTNGYAAAGAPWEIYLSDPSVPPKDRRTEIFIPVRRADAVGVKG